VHQFGGEDHFSRGVIHQGEPGGLAPWIELEPQGDNDRMLDGLFQDDGERISSPHRRFPSGKQDSCSPRMDRVERLLVGI
jgi:hypothetical protein